MLQEITARDAEDAEGAQRVELDRSCSKVLPKKQEAAGLLHRGQLRLGHVPTLGTTSRNLR
jgi:hypothetical protein